MSSTTQEFKTTTEDTPLQLPPMYQIPKALENAQEFEVQIDPKTLSLIKIGDDGKWVLDEKLADRGQRYVAAFFIKNGKAVFRAYPSFDRVLAKPDKEEFKKLIEHIAKHFSTEEHKCDPDEVVFPDDAKYTGIVHNQLRERIADLEPRIVLDAIIPSLSFYKKNGVYEWENRSALNGSIFSIDPLALACFVFDENCLTEPNPHWDRYYHLRRSVPADVFVPIATSATKIICGDTLKADFKKCFNVAYENKWNELREKYKTDHQAFAKEIQEMLIKNVYIFLTNKTALQSRPEAISILIKGFAEAKKYGVQINFDIIPDLFKGEKNVFELMRDILHEDDPRFEGNKLAINILYEKLTEIVYDEVEKPIFVAMAEMKYSLACELLKKLEYKQSGYQYRITPEIKNFFLDIFSDEKPDFTKKNKNGETLLQLVVKSPAFDAELLAEFLQIGFEINIVDKDGFTPLYYALKNQDGKKCDLLLKAGADPFLKGEHGKSVFEYVFERYQESNSPNELEYLITVGKKLPEADIANDAITEILYKRMMQTIIIGYNVQDLNNLIKNQTNHKSQTNLQIILLKIFNKLLDEKTEEGIKAILNLDISEFKLSVDIDVKKIQDSLLIMIATSKSNEARLRLIDTILNGNQIAQILLQSADFKSKLEQLQRKADLSIKIDKFISYVQAGDIGHARETIRGLSRDDLLPAITNPFLKHLADILLEDKPDFNKRNSEGKTLLYLLHEQESSSNRTDLVRRLLIRGATLLPLHEDFKASFDKQNVEEMKKIASYIHYIQSANDPYKDQLPESPFFPPRFIKSLYEVLWEEKPNFNKISRYEYESLLHMALKEKDDLKLFTALLKFDINPNIDIERVETPLLIALKDLNMPAVKLLLDAKADLFYSHNHYQSAFEYVLSEHKDEYGKLAVQLFEEHVNRLPDYLAESQYKLNNIARGLTQLVCKDPMMLGILLKKIDLQTNEIIKTQLNNVVMQALEDNLNYGLARYPVLKILQLTKQQYHVNSDYDVSKLINKILEYLKDKYSHNEHKLAMLDAILDGQNAIGDYILKSKNGAQIKEELLQIRIQAQHKKNIDNYLTSVNEGDFDQARNYLTKIPKELMPKIEDPLIRHLTNILMEENPNFNAVNDHGQTLLHLIVSVNYYVNQNLIKLILQSKIDPNIKDKQGYGALYYALTDTRWDRVSEFLELKSEYQADKKYPENLLEEFTDQYQHSELFSWLIKNNFKYSEDYVKEKSDKIEYQLKNVIDNSPKEDLPGIFDTIELLIRNHANPDIQKSLAKIIINLFLEKITEYYQPDPERILKLLNLELKPVEGVVGIDLFNIKVELRGMFARDTDLSNDHKIQIIDKILDPTSFIGKQLLKTEPTVVKFSTSTKYDAEKFREELTNMKAKLVDEQQRLERKT